MSKKIHHGRRGYASSRTDHANREKMGKTQGRRLVSKEGKPLWNNITDYLKFLEKESGTLDYLTMRNFLLETVDERKRKGRGLTTNGFQGTLEQKKRGQEYNRVRIMLSNMGYTAEEFAEEYNIPVEDILNESNWHGNEFTSGGYTYEYRFGYNGQNLVRIKT